MYVIKKIICDNRQEKLVKEKRVRIIQNTDESDS